MQKDIAEALADSDLRVRSAQAMRRILDSIDAELTPTAAPWVVDRQVFVDGIAERAPSRFSDSFGRWRQLYEGARAQLREANRRSEMVGLPAAERREAKALQAQANEQIALLERGSATGGTDFSTYRYLATEGFLPGYNFPRLPLYAYVPAVSGGGPKAAYLQRARFIAIAEFGPRSLIYHEGRAYRVYKAKLPQGIRPDEGGRLVTDVVYVCDECGAAHQREEPERCHVCRSPMGGIHPIRNVLRIDNVETAPAERITANDEDRQRQGFDIQTVFAWPRRDGVIDVTTAVASDDAGPILSLAYGQGATISRLNKGLRRRKEKSIFGFVIDPATGRWIGSKNEGDDEDPSKPGQQRVVPIVQDNKNALLLRLPEPPLSQTALATLQHALARGLEVIFQLEEGEVSTEPVPSRDRRRAILFFEATEGGAGVLGRLTSDPSALSRVARKALELMHFAAHQAGGQTEADYGIPKGLTLRDEIARYFRIGQALFAALTATENPSAGATINFVEDLLRVVFGFADLKRIGLRTLGDRQFAVTLEGLGGRVPIVVVPPGDELDRPSEHLPADGRRRSAASAIQDWLNANEGELWGFCCNGFRLRLVRDNASLTRPAYIEADLRAIFEEERFRGLHSALAACSRKPLWAARRASLRLCSGTLAWGGPKGRRRRPRSLARQRRSRAAQLRQWISRAFRQRRAPREATRRRTAVDGLLRPAAPPRLSSDLPARSRGPRPAASAGHKRRARASSTQRAIRSARCAKAPCGAPPGIATTTVGKGC